MEIKAKAVVTFSEYKDIASIIQGPREIDTFIITKRIKYNLEIAKEKDEIKFMLQR